MDYLQLVSWEEGGYRTSDKPMPRGEVVVGGFSITAGYFNNAEKTDEAYKVDTSVFNVILQRSSSVIFGHICISNMGLIM